MAATAQPPANNPRLDMAVSLGSGDPVSAGVGDLVNHPEPNASMALRDARHAPHGRSPESRKARTDLGNRTGPRAPGADPFPAASHDASTHECLCNTLNMESDP